MIKYIVLLIAIICMASCRPEFVENNGQQTVSPYYDVNNVIDADYQIMKRSKKLERQITLNGITDTVNVSDTASNQEVSLLRSYDILNPKWIGKFKIDTLYGLYGDPDKISYQSMDEKIPIKNLEVIFESGRVIEIRGLRETKSLINSHDQKMSYFPGNGYAIDSKQTTWTGDTMHLKVQAKFY